LAGADEKEGEKIGKAARTLAQGTLPVTYEEERALGGGVAVKAFETFGPYYDDPDLQRYVTMVGKAIGAVSDRPEIPYAFAVIDNETPNAFAGPGGYIFITVGSLRNMNSEAELAGILAHEIGHVCARHAIQTLQRGRILQGLAEGGSIADPKNKKTYGEAVDAIDDVLFNRGLDQNFEYEADLLGVDYAARAGYYPWGEVDFLRNLQKLQGVNGGWFQTHPPLSERISRLSRHLDGNYTDFRDLPQARERFRQNVTARLKPAK
jgi:predicted Zn-dependent protease